MKGFANISPESSTSRPRSGPAFLSPVETNRPVYDWRIGPGRTLELGRRTRVMGILNVTPDSFSDGGRFLDPGRAVDQARVMIEAGADLVDVGGESTRPGAATISVAEEIDRVVPVIRETSALGVPVSIDTTKVEVARAALEAGALIINDISGLRFEPELAGLAADAQAGLILMHSRGTPRDMQVDPRYDDVVIEVAAELETACQAALGAGVGESALVVDPGIGFSKTVRHNLDLLKRLWRITAGGRPVLLGASRKSFIGKTLDLPVNERVEGGLAVAVAGVMNGAHIVRVHDVGETRRAVDMIDAILLPPESTR